jgi:hypothetical protein
LREQKDPFRHSGAEQSTSFPIGSTPVAIGEAGA